MLKKRVFAVLVSMLALLGIGFAASGAAYADVYGVYDVQYRSGHLYGGAELFSNGKLAVCDDASDGTWVWGRVFTGSATAPNVLGGGVDRNGHSSPCASYDITPYLYNGIYLSVQVGVSNSDEDNILSSRNIHWKTIKSGFFNFAY